MKFLVHVGYAISLSIALSALLLLAALTVTGDL